MTDLAALHSRRFRHEHEDDWRRLERILARIEKGSLKQLSESEIISLPVLYRSTLSSLSTARAISLDRALVDYLESLSARAYFAVYGVRKSSAEMVLGFFLRDWPRAVRSLWRETVVAAGIFILATVVAFGLVMGDIGYFNGFMPTARAQGRTPDAPVKVLNEALKHDSSKDPLATFASYLFTHNAQVSFSVFALGVLCCVPSALMLAQNAVELGALGAVYARAGLGVDFFGWILIHGVTELSAIILAAAAGFRLGWVVLFPGERARLTALKQEARVSATVMMGVVVMLLVAGLLEGLGRQLIQATLTRYAVAAATLVGWGVYFYAPWRGRHEHR
jgi:uncharacterized membrane protein SpoIIM required for sporulation